MSGRGYGGRNHNNRGRGNGGRDNRNYGGGGRGYYNQNSNYPPQQQQQHSYGQYPPNYNMNVMYPGAPGNMNQHQPPLPGVNVQQPGVNMPMGMQQGFMPQHQPQQGYRAQIYPPNVNVNAPRMGGYPISSMQGGYVVPSPIGVGVPGSMPQQIPQPAQSSLQSAAQAARKKNVLKITDKDGNEIDISGGSSKKKGDTGDGKEKDEKNEGKNKPSSGGQTLMEAAQITIAKKEQEKKEAELKKKKEEEEQARKEAEVIAKEKAAKEAAEAEAAAKAKAEAEAKEKAEQEAKAKAEKEAEEARAKKEAEEAKAKKEAEDKLRRSKIFSRGSGGSSLSSLAARLSAKEEKEEDQNNEEEAKSDQSSSHKTDDQGKVDEGGKSSVSPSTPKPSPPSSLDSQASTSLRPGGSGSALRPGGGLRPGGKGSALRPGGGLRPGGLRPGGASPLASDQKQKTRRVFTKSELLKFRDLDICVCRPDDLPDMTVSVRSHGGSSRGNGGGGRGQWGKESLPNQNRRRSQGGRNGDDQWARAKTPPRGGRGRGERGGRGRGRGRGGRGGRGGYHDYDDEGPPPAPLVRSENRWMPKKDTNVIGITEKKVKSILNKMTKEKFAKLADQMIDIPITSYEILTKMIHLVYEKAIYEPSFGEIYAELCMRLSQKTKQNPFVHVIESDEEPPTEDGEVHESTEGISSHNTVYRWSNDVTTDDAEVIGPFTSVEECLDAAMDADICPEPSKRIGELILHTVKIQAGQFIKIMHPKDNPDEFFTVFFPMSKVEEIGQQISEIFLSEIECIKVCNKKNSFKGILLNKCQDEFQKKNLYDDWLVEKKEYDEKKQSLSESERLEKDEELEFRRMKIKKQVLGNIRFIGELFKIGMLRVRVMRDCIQSLLRLTETESGDVVDMEDQDMDEEDHEAVCKLFNTIGNAVDHGKTKPYIDLYFGKIERFSTDKNVNMRSRFLYKDLIDLRNAGWKARREEETAKTLDEIKKDFEREERMAQMQSQQMNQSYRGGGRNNRDNRDRGRGGGNRRNDGDYRDDRRNSNYGAPRRQKERVEPKVDKDGFVEVNKSSRGQGGSRYGSAGPKILSRNNSNRDKKDKSKNRERERDTKPTKAVPPPRRSPSPTAEPLSEEKLKLKAKTMRAEFMEQPNEDDLFMTMDELKKHPGAARGIVQASVDAALDCKDKERIAIVTIISTLFTNGKLTSEDIGGPFGDIIEFIDSFVVDSPRAMEYMGDMTAEFLHIKALDVAWLCTQAKKLEEFSAHLIPQVIDQCVKSLINCYSLDEAKIHFATATNELNALLGQEKWNEIEHGTGLK